MRLTIDATQVKGLQALWAHAPQIVGEEMYAVIVEADQFLKGELQQQLPRGAGGISGGAGLAGSIFTDEQRMADRVVGAVASPLIYAEYVELGTRPHMPPIEPLQDWVQVKLNITDEAESRSVAYLIARKISRVGTKPDGTWQRVYDANQVSIEARFARGVDRVLDRLGAPS